MFNTVQWLIFNIVTVFVPSWFYIAKFCMPVSCHFQLIFFAPCEHSDNTWQVHTGSSLCTFVLPPVSIPLRLTALAPQVSTPLSDAISFLTVMWQHFSCPYSSFVVIAVLHVKKLLSYNQVEGTRMRTEDWWKRHLSRLQFPFIPFFLGLSCF